jgi:quercetin dioxygenase-like cupin family protein
MKTHKLSDFYRGWLIGNFEPNVLKTEQFEVGLLSHPKGEKWDKHYHAIATEYNVLVKGKMIINNTPMSEGDVFIFEPGETADPEFLEDCLVLCVKTPSVPGDKYKVKDEE